MYTFRQLLKRVSEEYLLIGLVIALIPLLIITREPLWQLPRLVDWKTIGALAGLMILSRGLEVSGYLSVAGRWILMRMHSERRLAISLILFSAALSAVITNDVALFIVVPLTISLAQSAHLPVGRLIIFEALSVNAGSAISPIGNPQNLFLWQSAGVSFWEFTMAMVPLSLALMGILLMFVPFAFSPRGIAVSQTHIEISRQKVLFWISLILYVPFLVMTDWGYALPAAVAILLFYYFYHRKIALGADWFLLIIFVLMFITLKLLAELAVMRQLTYHLLALPGELFTAAVLNSQVMSNVPAAIYLNAFTEDWRMLAWGVSVGGFGLAIGSMANLIALRLAKQPGLWKEFHYWSIPLLIVGFVVAVFLDWLLNQAV